MKYKNYNFKNFAPFYFFIGLLKSENHQAVEIYGKPFTYQYTYADTFIAYKNLKCPFSYRGSISSFLVLKTWNTEKPKIT